jgi:hypothetical protein
LAIQNEVTMASNSSDCSTVWFDEKCPRTGVSEDTFEESFGPIMQLGGKKFVLGLLDGGGRGVR